jgi:hypothetical protein
MTRQKWRYIAPPPRGFHGIDYKTSTALDDNHPADALYYEVYAPQEGSFKVKYREADFCERNNSRDICLFPLTFIKTLELG